MKKKFNEKIRLIFTATICMLFITIAFSSAMGESLSGNDSVTNIEENDKTFIRSSGSIIRFFRPLPLRPWFYKIVNDDWNYWTNSPDIYVIPSGNVGIGTTNPAEKLEVVGTIKMTGFNMPTGAISGYVLTSDASGVGSWQYFSASDGHSLDAADGDPVNVVYVDNDGNVTINTSGVNPRMTGAGNNFDNPPNVNIEAEGSMTTTVGGSTSTSVGTNSQTTVGSDMNVNVGNDLDVTVGGNTNINSGMNLKITAGAGISLIGSTTIDGKLTVTGGIDPPYISFSKETHESIREYAKYVEDHEEVMQFWNGDTHRMEIYVISEDVFYTITGELMEE